ncbi:hypothetical protein PLEOSDRAFT_1070753 [Pleurotus ostreatus PC15]|uniref:Uncharacterized protein n=1 Tax=Pleurotus ostreatus (strain PC15) TaxID=1137138 RepID=A0A067NPU5_PLEO1|nr:hypothetical protein PLEOSDRAFT_1070753 [Pleurotus ostreatus PC15]
MSVFVSVSVEGWRGESGWIEGCGCGGCKGEGSRGRDEDEEGGEDEAVGIWEDNKGKVKGAGILWEWEGLCTGGGMRTGAGGGGGRVDLIAVAMGVGGGGTCMVGSFGIGIRRGEDLFDLLLLREMDWFILCRCIMSLAMHTGGPEGRNGFLVATKASLWSARRA